MALISDILREEVGVLVGGSVRKAWRGEMELELRATEMNLERRGLSWGVRGRKKGSMNWVLLGRGEMF